MPIRMNFGALRWMGLFFCATGLSMPVFSANASAQLTPSEVPATCRSVAGVYTYGSKTEALYHYRDYAIVMPRPARKEVQSLVCDGERGSLLYFTYRTAAERDQALLFARPVLDKQSGLAHPLPLAEFHNGFVVVSFKNPPVALVAALDKKYAPPHADAASAPVPVSKTGPSSIIVSTPVSTPVSTSGSTSVSPPAPSVTASTPAVSSVLRVSSRAVSAPVSAVSQVSTPVSQVSPTSAVAPTSPVMPGVLPATPPMSAPSPRPVKRAPLIKPLANSPVPVAAMTPPVSSVPRTTVVTNSAIPKSDTVGDMAISVISAFAAKLGCDTGAKQAEIRAACEILQEFAAGLPVEFPIKPGTVYLGIAYTADSYGRFADLHYDVVAGVDRPDELAFFAYHSTSGTEDFELKNLVDAKKSQKPLPANSALAKINQLAARKKFPVRMAERSALIRPGGTRLVYIRRAGDHLVMLAPAGNTPDEQTRGTLVIAALY